MSKVQPQVALQKATNTIDGYQYFLEVTNYWQYTSELFELATHLPPCGLNPNSSRTWVRIYDQNGNHLYGVCILSEPAQLELLSFWASNEELPTAASVVLLDRECNKEYRSNLVTLATPQSPPSAKPDLVVSSLTVTSFTEESISYSYQITNIGEAPANLDDVGVQALLSEDTIFQPYTGDLAAGGTNLGPSPLGQLEPGQSFSHSFSASSSGFTPSMQYLVLMVDWSGNVDELNEENNTTATLLPPRTSSD